jgi:hypothetical protein
VFIVFMSMHRCHPSTHKCDGSRQPSIFRIWRAGCAVDARWMACSGSPCTAHLLATRRYGLVTRDRDAQFRSSLVPPASFPRSRQRREVPAVDGNRSSYRAASVGQIPVRLLWPRIQLFDVRSVLDRSPPCGSSTPMLSAGGKRRAGFVGAPTGSDPQEGVMGLNVRHPQPPTNENGEPEGPPLV